MNLNDIRTKYPAYKNVSDGDLADALHKQYYSNIDRDKFNTAIGYSSIGGTLQHSAERAIAPTLAGIPAFGIGAEAGAMVGAPLAPITGGLSIPAGALLGGFGGMSLVSSLANKAQDMALNAMPKVTDYLGLNEKTSQLERQQHPITSAFGELAIQALAFRPSLTNLKSLVTSTEGMSAKSAQNIVATRMNIGAGATMGAGMEAYNQYKEGKFNGSRLAIETLAGGLLNKPTALGAKLSIGSHQTVTPDEPLPKGGETILPEQQPTTPEDINAMQVQQQQADLARQQQEAQYRQQINDTNTNDLAFAKTSKGDEVNKDSRMNSYQSIFDILNQKALDESTNPNSKRTLSPIEELQQQAKFTEPSYFKSANDKADVQANRNIDALQAIHQENFNDNVKSIHDALNENSVDEMKANHLIEMGYPEGSETFKRMMIDPSITFKDIKPFSEVLAGKKDAVVNDYIQHQTEKENEQQRYNDFQDGNVQRDNPLNDVQGKTTTPEDIAKIQSDTQKNIQNQQRLNDEQNPTQQPNESSKTFNDRVKQMVQNRQEPKVYPTVDNKVNRNIPITDEYKQSIANRYSDLANGYKDTFAEHNSKISDAKVHRVVEPQMNQEGYTKQQINDAKESYLGSKAMKDTDGTIHSRDDVEEAVGKPLTDLINCIGAR